MFSLNFLIFSLCVTKTGAQDERIEAILPLLLIVTVTGLIYWYSKDFSSRVELLVQKFRRAEDRGKCSGWNCTQLFAV